MGNTQINSEPASQNLQDFKTRFHTYLEETNKSVSSTGKVNILSYNIFIRPPFVNNNGNDYKDERLEEFLKYAQNYDIICLQEMFNVYSNRRTNFLQKSRDLGFIYHATASKMQTFSPHFIDSGLLILSKLKVL